MGRRENENFVILPGCITYKGWTRPRLVTSYLSKYNETLEHGPNYLKPPLELIEGEEEWEVEAILNEKYDKRKKK